MSSGPFDDKSPIYNSRIIKPFIFHLGNHYPEVDVDEVLAYSGMSRLSVEDQAVWFSQAQVDRFNEIVVEKTRNPKIARDVGRISLSYGGFGAAQQYTIGLMGLTHVYRMITKVNALVNRGAIMKAVKLGPNSVEVISIPAPGVVEKPYQCENRIGIFEASALMFSEKFAQVEHPTCYHKGGESCRYVITWESMPSIRLKRFRNLLGLTVSMAGAALFPLLSTTHWTYCLLSGIVVFALFSSMVLVQEKKELTQLVKRQGNTAKDLIDEADNRLNNSLLVHEVGQALAHILNIDDLVNTVVNIMVRRMDFDRGLIMLANTDRTRLIYSAGYGYSDSQEKFLRGMYFHLDNPRSKGPFVLAFQQQQPLFVDEMAQITKNLSEKSQELSNLFCVQSMICAPILFEKESLGILAVDNVNGGKKLSESDRHLLTGVAAQTAVGIVNARSFQKLQESEKEYRELVENANSIIMRMNARGRISFFNDFGQKLFGYAEKEILGENIRTTILSGFEDSEHYFLELTSSLEKPSDRKIVFQTAHRLKSGVKVWITWTCKPIFDRHGTFTEILCIGSDTTELKRSAEEKKDLEAKLQRAQKMEALGTLAGGVAHDLNNILSGIVSYPELLLMEIPADSPLRQSILTIQKSGEKAAAIVQDLLTLARRGVDTVKAINLNQVVSGYLKSPEYKKLQMNHPQVNVKAKLAPDLFNIIGSTVHLSKVLMNLVSNAAEAMPSGGDMLIRTENRYIDQAVNGYDHVSEGNYVTVTVLDTGIGIPRDSQERIFEPFYTKKLMGRSGTGLGLAIVWGTVKDHNGYIDLTSREGEGTAFTLYFPVTRQELVKTPAEISTDDFRGHRESVLVVDDAESQREIAALILKKLGYRVGVVSSGEEAIAYLKKKPVDILVLDMIMEPGMDGLDTYREILAFRPDTKAVIASGFSETERVRELQRLGAGTYVKKPYNIEKLGVAIRSELDGLN